MLTGTAVLLQKPQHDGYVTNTIIWSAKVGVNFHSPAAQIAGVHPWNYVLDEVDRHQVSKRADYSCTSLTCSLTQTSLVNGAGVGILVDSPPGRVEDCYLDTVPLVINGTASTMVRVIHMHSTTV